MTLKQKELPEDIIKAFEELEVLSRDPEMRDIALNWEMSLRDEIFRQEGFLEAAMTKMRVEIKADLKAELNAENEVDKALAVAEALVKGEAKAIKELAKKMKDSGQPIELIAQITGLSAEEIENL